MKKLVFTIVCLYSAASVYAQTSWFNPHATWYYHFQEENINGYIELTYEKDTSVNMTTVQKINKNLVSYNNLTNEYDTTYLGFECMRADSDRVYIWHQQVMLLLYNFAVLPGDTIEFAGNYDWDGCDSIGHVIVDSTGTMVINGETLRFYTVDTVPGSQWGWHGRIVEKIGAIDDYFLPTKYDTCGVIIEAFREAGTFRCYYDSLFAPYSVTAQACNYISNVTETLQNKNSMHVYPNPAGQTAYIHLENVQTSASQIEIRDLTGKLVQTLHVNPSTTLIPINVTAFSPGMYIVQWKNNWQQPIASQRLVVQE